MAIPSRLRIGSRGVSRIASLGIWALAAGCVVHWGLQLGNPGQVPVQVAASEFSASADAKQMRRLLGHNDAAPAVTVASIQHGRYDLLGVVSGGPNGGAAIISVDGRPARSFLIGREVGDAVRLHHVSARSAVLAPQQGEQIVLHMKPLNGAQTAAHSGMGGFVAPSLLPSPPLPPPVPMPEGPSEVEQASAAGQAPRVAANSLKPGAMRLQRSAPSEAAPSAALRQPGAAMSAAGVFGVSH